jgi:nucleotidyltransferase/DNA polymerase involved in DNA repair
MSSPVRTILHVDLDAFYAAVEVRENPALGGGPVIVGADPCGGRGRGVVAAANYAARAFGVHSAMPISQAYRRCPQAVYLSPRMALYAAVSRRFMAILRRYSDLVEPLSIDEAFVDATRSRRLFGDGEVIAQQIKTAVREEERLTASIGVAPSKFVAKIASDLRKPDGLVVVRPDEVEAFLCDLPVHRLWGAGPKTVAALEGLGLTTIGAVAGAAPGHLAAALGETAGQHLQALARGEDERAVVSNAERKSVGRETTFAEDVADRRIVAETLLALVEDVARRLRRASQRAQLVHVKLRTADFTTVTRQAALPHPVDTAEPLWHAAKLLLDKADTTHQAIRLVGVSVTLAGGESQLVLFDDGVERQRRVARALDALYDRFGTAVVRRGVVARTRRRQNSDSDT